MNKIKWFHRKKKEPWGRRPLSWYDAAYEKHERYQDHYSRSIYYPLWSVIADRMKRQGESHILDLGCGPGQFGAFLHDQGFSEYCGIDFSAVCIDLARRACPWFEFIQGDVLETDILRVRPYNCLIACEFLEHVENDLEILQHVRPGTRFFGTVPSFPYVSHVRHFTGEPEVDMRYRHLFESLSIQKFVINPNGESCFIMEGIMD
jgi:SAM-dependent methyltransferase